MIVLDTNVLSELMRPKPNQIVVNWVASKSAKTLFITSLTQAEILYGLELLPTGKRRKALQKAARLMFEEDFRERILSFDTDAAQNFATIAAKRRILGHPISQIDAQIAAITYSHSGILATRNIVDFQDCGIALVNPWDSVD
jgi:hypothetical protein